MRKVVRQPTVNKAEIKKLYCGFADLTEGGQDAIFGEGLLVLFERLGVDPATDLVALSVAHQCGAAAMGMFSRREFITGCAALGVETLDGLQRAVGELRQRLRSKENLGEVYMYTFGIAVEPPSKVLPVEEAVQYWALLLQDWGLCKAWCQWAAEVYKKPIARDLWAMVFKLANEVPTDLSTYDEDPSWPVALDDFVESQRNQDDAMMGS